MPTLYVRPNQKAAILAGAVRQVLQSRSEKLEAQVGQPRAGDTLRIYQVNAKGWKTRIGVAACTGVFNIDVALGDFKLDGRGVDGATIAELVNPGIKDKAKQLHLGNSVSKWFTAQFGVPTRAGDKWVPFRGVLIRWGELTERGELNHERTATS